MKKKRITSIFIVCALCFLLIGCGKKAEESENVDNNEAVVVDEETSATEEEISDVEKSDTEEDMASLEENIVGDDNTYDEDYWSEILDMYYKHLLGIDVSELETPFLYVSTGVHEQTYYAEDDSLNDIGYAFIDLNDDGKNELLIGCPVSEYTEHSEILAGYTIVEGTPFMIIEGWARNRQYLLPDNIIYNEGSNGASYFLMGTYKLDKDAMQLTCEDFYFTDYLDNNIDDLYVFYNNIGEWDIKKSSQADLSPDSLYNMSQEYLSTAQIIDFIPFSNYSSSVSEGPHGTADKPVYVRFFVDATADVVDYDSIVLDNEDNYGVEVVFMTEEEVKNVKILALSLDDIDDDGNASFSYEIVYTQEKLTPKKSLIVTMMMPEIAPIYGISYETSDGTVYVEGLEQSGMDGSVFLNEISLK